MITKEQITALVSSKIADQPELFVVDINVRPGNVVEVILDGDAGVTIETCTEIHRHILREIDREVVDYSLEVSSPDLTKPLKVARQYIKNIGRDIVIRKLDKSKHVGTMIAADDAGCTIEFEIKEEVPGKKAKQKRIVQENIPYSEMHDAKIAIRF